MKALYIMLLMITFMPLFIILALVVPFALIGALATLAMTKIQHLVEILSDELNKITGA